MAYGYVDALTRERVDETTDFVSCRLGRGKREAMADLRTDAAFFEYVSKEARVPESDARALVQDFLRAISYFIGESATSVLADIAPTDLTVPSPAGNRQAEATIEEFLLEMSDEESVAEDRAADHARVVAEALRMRADGATVQRLKDSIENEEILALFELERGELTEI